MRFGLNFSLAGPLSDAAIVAQLTKETENVGWDGCFVWDHLRLAVELRRSRTPGLR
jgi:hypothetical protein